MESSGRQAIAGVFFDGKTASTHPATLEFSGSEFILRVAEESCSFPALHTKLSPRLGNIPRAFEFPNGGRFETSDHEAVDFIQQRLGRRDIAHRLEQSWRLTAFAVGGLAALLVFTYFVLLPAFAERIAAKVPRVYEKSLSDYSATILEKSFLSESNASARANALAFDACRHTLAAFPELPLKIYLRRGGALRANAFALPDGTIYLTDEMAELAENKEEIMAVLFHEAGHVRLKHSLQQIIQDSSLSFALFAMVGGDWTQIPLVFLSSRFSRDHESAADHFALENLAELGINPKLLAVMLERMSKGEHSDPYSFLASHPLTAERGKVIREFPFAPGAAAVSGRGRVEPRHNEGCDGLTQKRP